MAKIIRSAIGLLLIAGFVLGGIVISRRMLDKGLHALKTEDYSEAERYLKPMAMIGNTIAQYQVGNMYAFGWGVKKEDTEAIKWFRRAGFEYADHRDRAAAAEYYVGEKYREDYEYEGVHSAEKAREAIKWYLLSAEGGDPRSAQLLGKIYGEGLLGEKVDLSKSQYWYDLAKHSMSRRTQVH
ncbi:MAG: sel1 repeat family protein [Nitrospirae bacterium]|nr:sel1 repeat family protein [Nitrospirota bacterium]